MLKMLWHISKFHCLFFSFMEDPSYKSCSSRKVCWNLGLLGGTQRPDSGQNGQAGLFRGLENTPTSGRAFQPAAKRLFLTPNPQWAMRALPLTQPTPEGTSHHSLQAFKQAYACPPPIKSRVSPESSKSRSSFSGPFCKSDLTLRKSLIYVEVSEYN